MSARECPVAGCKRVRSDGGLCARHYKLRREGKSVLPCPVCGEPLREPAPMCGWCIEERRAA